MKEMDYKYYSRKRLMPAESKVSQRTRESESASQRRIVEEAHRAWEALSSYRAGRVRCRDYTFGRQWNDAVLTSDGRVVSEEVYLREQGKLPLKNNLIRQLVKSVLGQFRSAQTEPVCVSRDRSEQALGEVMSSIMQYAYQHNRLYELDSRTLEEFLISGSCFHKVGYGERRGKSDVWVDAVQPGRIFFDAMEDSRLWDCRLIGELHDMTLYEVISRFSQGEEHRIKWLRQIYNDVQEERLYDHYEILKSDGADSLEFFMAKESDRCRVIELWRKESHELLRCHDTLTGELYKVDVQQRDVIEQENRRRIKEASRQGVRADDVALIESEWRVEDVWQYYFLSPMGDVLESGESPYWHGEHPYAMSLYPLLDGEIHSFVEDVIDQQRYINRLITMIDFIMGSSAKGVLLFPENQIPEGMSIEEIAEEWTRYNGVIMFSPKPGSAMPQQVSVNATNVGAYELLSLQMRLLEDISGVHSAMQGKSVASGTPASLYAPQVQYSAVNLLDILETFKTFRENRDYKILKTIQQYYPDHRYELIAGSADEELKAITPEQVRNAEFDLNITESAAAPAFRQSSNDFLLSLFNTGHISLQTLLQTGAFPFADKLLQSLTIEQQQLQQQQQQMMQQVEPSQETNPIAEQVPVMDKS